MTAPTPTPRSGRGRPLLLAASLALNLLVVGAVAGTALLHRAGWRPEPTPGVAGRGLPAFLRTLPPDRRRELRQALIAERPTLVTLATSAVEARRQLLAAMAADPLDGPAVEAASRRLLDVESEVRREQLRLVAALLPRMTREERGRFVAWRAALDTARERKLDLEREDLGAGEPAK
jgi:uncharacterized membrane protein